MPISVDELTDAKDAARALLDALALEAYLFEIEPGKPRWELKLECAFENGWQTIRVPVDKALLLASRTDDTARKTLLTQWQEKITSCKVEGHK